MKHLLVLILSIMLFSCAAINREPLPYTKSDKILTTSLLGLQVIDSWQTDKLSNSSKFEEGNPVVVKLIGKEVNFLQISILKATIMAPAYYFYIHKAKTRKQRNFSLWIFNIISVAPVISNSIIGADVLFKF